MLPTPLAPLAQYAQFVVWRAIWNADRGKFDKILYSPKGYKASHSNPADWGAYAEAQATYDRGGYDGVGFVFTEADPFWFVDIDGAYDEATQKWSPIAEALCAQLAGAAIEVSHSGKGLHIIGSGTVPPDHGSTNKPLGIELYTKTRFCATTGTNASGSVLADLTAPITAVVEKFFTRAVGDRATEWTTEPCAEWAGPEDDMVLLERALRSQPGGAKGAFGNAVSFSDLFTADADALGTAWPSTTGGAYDGSSADQSFMNMLAFWTGKDCARMERIGRMSALARPKWDDHPTYLEVTILKAVGTVKSVYSQPERETVQELPPPRAGEPTPNNGGGVTLHAGGIMPYHLQTDYFDGCIYVQSINKVLTPSGDLLDQARFNVVFGGYDFVQSSDGKKLTSSAWTAYTENQNHKPVMADRICFRPEHGAGGVINDSGKILANTYQPAEHDDLHDDASKFMDHLKLMFPHGEDFEILVSWMASVAQNPGMKAQWWPVVQGAEGNFKSFLLVIMAHAVGTHYAHLPNMEKMIRAGSNFNGWMERKLFVGMDEVYAANRREFFEGFKTTVTNRFLAIEGKGVEETTSDNRANGMIVTNHQTGVPISGKNRRLAAFFAAQQTRLDMIRDGMDAKYISDMATWLNGEGAYSHLGANYGIRCVVGHLRTRAIEARLDPALLSLSCPDTTSTAAALHAGLGRAEQEVMEAIEEERVGFAGGWVSSTFLDRLLDHIRISVPRNQRKDLMETLGYLYHPLLGPSGRATTMTQPDNGKPRLYIRKGHLSLNLTEPVEVVRAYAKAQDKVISGETAAAFNAR